MRTMKISGAAVLLTGALFVTGDVLADPGGVPVPESPPLTCDTLSFRVEVQKGANGEFPKAADCGGNVCSAYGYTVSSPIGLKLSQVVFSVSATQNFVSSDPSSSQGDAGAGDSTTGFLAGAVHEYAVRFNANSTVYSAIITTEGPSASRIGTALIKSGKVVESCLIATPGVSGSVFQPVAQTQTVLLAGSKCLVNLIYDTSGKVANITPAAGSPQNCHIVLNAGTGIINGNPIQHSSSPVTFGTGTTTCFYPPLANPTKCVCTKLPCP